jgi:hypothetical protein
MNVTMAWEDEPVTQPATWMTDPSWFLVTALPWPEDQAEAEITEAAFAIAPYVTQAVRPTGPEGKPGKPVPLGRDLALMLDAGSRCAAALGKRVLFVSDITAWLADIGLSWERLGVDSRSAENDLEQQAIGMYLAVSRRAYSIVCSVSDTLTIHYTSGLTAEVRTRGTRTGQGKAGGSTGHWLARLRDHGAGERTARRLSHPWSCSCATRRTQRGHAESADEPA